MARRILTALLIALVAAGCGEAPPTGPAATTAGVTTTTLPSKAVLKAALLGPVDLPGSIAAEGTADVVATSSADPASCAGMDEEGAAAADAMDVTGPDLELHDGQVLRFYSSTAGRGSLEEVTGFITQLTSPSGITCGVDVIKATMSGDVDGVKIDASGLSGTGSAVPVGDGAGIIRIRGKLKVQRQRVPVGADVIVFRKGNVAVMVMAFAARGEVVEGQAVELAQRIAGRLP